MGNAIHLPVYVFNPKKDIIIEIDGEDYNNLTQGKNDMIKHPIKLVEIDRDGRVGKRLDEIGKRFNNSLVSMMWGFFEKTSKGEKRVGISREREIDIYEGLRDYFVKENFAVYDANVRKII